MKVTLLSYTPDALNLLLVTKGTRLAHGEDPSTWSPEKKQEHLDYMRDTIKSSWEFVDYAFKIEGVTRAFTHQLVRTRPDSYAQEAMRVVDVRERAAVIPESVNTQERQSAWERAEHAMMNGYAELIGLGVPVQDARGILPTNIPTSIIVKKNLRSLANTAELRLCTRTQGEYQNVFREMKRLVVEVHPWAEEFINVYCVNHTHCAFPRYGEKECPVYPVVMPNRIVADMRKTIKARFNSVRHEAAMVAKDGKAQ